MITSHNTRGGNEGGRAYDSGGGRMQILSCGRVDECVSRLVQMIRACDSSELFWCNYLSIDSSQLDVTTLKIVPHTV